MMESTYSPKGIYGLFYGPAAQKTPQYLSILRRFLVVEMRGIEPLSEKKAVRVSPGAECLLNFPQCERTHALYTLVAS